MKIHLYTDLPLWSLTTASGAKSFNETIVALRTLGELNIFSSAPDTNDEQCSVRLKSFNPHRFTESRSVKLIFKPLFFFLNTIYIFTKMISNSRETDVVYCYEIAHAVPCKLFCALFGKRLVLRFQGTLLNGVFVRSGLSKYLFLLRHFDHVMAMKISANLVIMTNDGTQGDKVLDWFGNSSPRLFLVNGVETYKLTAAPAHNLAFVACGRLVAWKNVDRVLEIFAAIYKSLPDSRLTIVGDGPMRAELVKLAEKLEVAAVVDFAGALTHRQAIEQMAKHKFYISCFSLSNVGNPLMESMQLGLVPVTLSNGTTGELVQDGENGILSEPDSYLSNASKFLANYQSGLRYKQSQEFWTWDQRMALELDAVKRLLQ